MENSSPMKTPMSTSLKLYSDPDGKDVNATTYRGMIGSLMYLTASRPDIMFSTFLCARFQSKPKESHLAAVKRIIRYLKGTADLGLWYPKETVPGRSSRQLGVEEAKLRVHLHRRGGVCSSRQLLLASHLDAHPAERLRL
ncbi:hypothetical protein L6452_36408 [Arctium lappa]|uniref:Uncharacterized protein n=1 Tax=Arctium lappa TaxID=4217 RepID=A0ACB8YDB2_ARCLA|nr:hypothetical protein L6452_36408 [Arctium lappa]